MLIVAGLLSGILATHAALFSVFQTETSSFYTERQNTHLQLYGKVLRADPTSITIETDSLYPPEQVSMWTIQVPKSISITNETRPQSREILVGDYVTLLVMRQEGRLVAMWDILVKKHQ